MEDNDWPFFDLAQEQKNVSNSPQEVSLNMWGSCTPKTFMKTIRRTACLKPLHVALLREVLSTCENAGLPVFAYAGTALGLYREGGEMLSHDYDSDLAVLEYQDAKMGSLSKLANFCLSSNIQVSGIEGFDESPVSLRQNDDIPKISHGLLSCAESLPRIKPVQLRELVQDLSNIHVDLFTLSPHPSSPVQHLRVNWHLGNGYNSSAKLFARDAFFPLKSMVYEDLPILAPANLEAYLTVEYGYLGRDAMYDRETQRYVKISDDVFRQLPAQMQKLLSRPTIEQKY
ncbi:unnamed protein product [Dibothriocephalus latus]|uniref:LicD family protein n=1 Tax=Dibothriocephalus latus TaxID=60516 RepID=A0A3P7KY51_DIBLA|nr:unnamed protein product [Dibothriocephalus latus]